MGSVPLGFGVTRPPCDSFKKQDQGVRLLPGIDCQLQPGEQSGRRGCLGQESISIRSADLVKVGGAWMGRNCQTQLEAGAVCCAGPLPCPAADLLLVSFLAPLYQQTKLTQKPLGPASPEVTPIALRTWAATLSISWVWWASTVIISIHSI